MNHCAKKINYQCNTKIIGNSVDIDLDEQEKISIQADVFTKKHHYYNIWGHLKNQKMIPLEGVLVKLVKNLQTDNGQYYQVLASHITDADGFYQFKQCYLEDNCSYQIIIEKKQSIQISTKQNHQNSCFMEFEKMENGKLCCHGPQGAETKEQTLNSYVDEEAQKLQLNGYDYECQ